MSDGQNKGLGGSTEVLEDFAFEEDENEVIYEDYGKELDDGFDLEDEELENDKDLEPELRDGDNKECLQAMQYDRAFVLNGPVVKVYKNSDENEIANQQRLKYLMHLPVIKDNKGQIIEPRNITLHNNESSMLFLDSKNNNRVISYDLEKGQIADEFHTEEALGELGVDQVVNEMKNGQTTASRVFQGMNQRNMFTLDPRLNTADRIATSRPYKTDPMFACMATSEGGQLALGSYDGKIRLYKQVGQDAKTLLPGLGDHIIHLEVSRDGCWVLATT